MSIKPIRFSKGLIAPTLVLLMVTWPQLVFAQTEAYVFLVNVVPGKTKDISVKHRQDSIKWSIYILEKIENDIREFENPAYLNKFKNKVKEEYGKTPSMKRFIRDLEALVKNQKKALQNLLTLPGGCAELNEDGKGLKVVCTQLGTEEAQGSLIDVWSSKQQQLEDQSALMLIDYDGRETYFYSKSSGNDGRTVWGAKSPECPDDRQCPLEISKNQIPMDQGSVLLTLYYLRTTFSHYTGQYIILYWLGEEMCDIYEEAIWNQDGLNKEGFITERGIPRLCGTQP